MENIFQIRVSDELLNAMLELSGMVDGLDVSGIVRKTIRWLNKGNTPPDAPSRMDFEQYMSMAHSRHNNRLIKVRTEEEPPPDCKPSDFRRVLAYRVLTAIANMHNRPNAFSTKYVNGKDFVVIEQA